MDISTIIGLIAGVILIYVGMTLGGNSVTAFYDAPSVVLVGGGAVCVAMISFPMRSLLATGKVLKNSFLTKAPDPQAIINDMVRYAEIARRDGILALENTLKDIKDPFIVTGVQMAVDGTDPELIQDILNCEMDATADRHSEGKAILDNLGKYAPAFGMIGTLVGLVLMLRNMGDDASKIGPSMAVALLTTLYGALIANLICLPLGEKLALRSKQELFIKAMIVKGVMSIQSGDNPRIVEQKLKTFLPPKLRKLDGAKGGVKAKAAA